MRIMVLHYFNLVVVGSSHVTNQTGKKRREKKKSAENVNEDYGTELHMNVSLSYLY